MAGRFLRGNSRKAIGQPARLLIAPYNAPMPAKLSDLVSLTTYDPNPTYQFIDIGLTRAALTITVQADSNNWDSQQSGRYATVPTNRWATVASEALEIDQDRKVYLMDADAATDSTTNEHRTDFSLKDSFVQYRLAAIYTDRFRYVHGHVFPLAQWDGSAVAMAMDRGAQQAIPFSFNAMPDDAALSAVTNQPLFRVDFDQF